jgi:putative thioredoxin
MSGQLIDFGARPAGAKGGQTAAGDELVRDASTRTFMADVIEASRRVPVVVDFWAPWCGPCKQLGPLIERLVREMKGAVRLVKVNVDENQQLAAQMRIQSIPAVFAFVNGQPADGFMGALPESELRAFLKKLAGDGGMAEEIAAAVAEARSAVEAGDTEKAAQIFAAVLEADGEHVEALAGLARCQIAMGDLDGAGATLARVPAAKAGHAEIAGARAALELAANPVDLGEVARLEAAVAADAADRQSRFDLAVALNGAGRREEALDHLLHILRHQRAWNEEAARKQILMFFEAWGPMDELTLSGRRKLSAILFS